MKIFVVLAAALACASANPQVLAVNPWGLSAGWPFVNTVNTHHAISLSAAPVAAAPVVAAAAPIVAAPVAAAPVAAAVVAPVATKTQYHAQDELGQYSYGYAHPGQAAAETRDAFGNVRGSYAYVNPEGREVRVNYVADSVNGFRAESNALPVGPAPVPAAPTVIAAAPVVQDTAEVIVARAAHAQAHQAAALAAAVHPVHLLKKRAAVFTTAAVAHPFAYTTAHHVPAVTYAAHPVAYTTAAHVPAVHYTTAAVATPAVHYTTAAHPIAATLLARKKRQVAFTAAPLAYTSAVAAHPWSYTTAAHVPAYTTADYTPAYTYGTYGSHVAYLARKKRQAVFAAAAPVAYTAANPWGFGYSTAAHVAPAVHYSTAYSPATLQTVHNNPGHAVSYRVY